MKNKSLEALLLGVCILLGFLVAEGLRDPIQAEAQTQPVYIPRVGGHGADTVLTNATLRGTDTRIGGTSLNMTNPTFRGTSPKFGSDSLPDMDSSVEVGWLQIQADGKFQRSFDGSSLVNLTFPVTQEYHFHGKTTFIETNVVFKVIDFITNSIAAGGATIPVDLNNSMAGMATNANFAITGLSGKDVGGTNMNVANYFITNSAAAAISCTMHATFQNMDAVEGNTLYITNLGHILTFHYPGMGTNFYFQSR